MIPITTTFSDIFKSSYLENITSFSLFDTMVAMALAFVIGMFIFVVYKKTFNGVMYSTSFAVSLLAMTLITTFVLLAVTSNVVLSLGMVGALSIVRFRTAVKEPLEISFLFWAIAVGIVLGAGMFPLAVIGSVLIGIILTIFVNRRPSDSPYIIVVKCEGKESEQEALKLISANTKKQVIKSKTAYQSGVEFTVEIRLKDDESGFINQISGINGVESAVLVSYNGDYMA